MVFTKYSLLLLFSLSTLGFDLFESTLMVIIWYAFRVPWMLITRSIEIH